MADADRSHLTIPRRTRLALAVEARVDVRTIELILQGKPVRGDAGTRATEVLRAHGHLPKAGSAA